VSKLVLFVQGAGRGAHRIDARLAASLGKALGERFQVRYPRLPREDSPDDSVWKKRLAAEVGRLGAGGIVVAHSGGAAALIRMLAGDGAGEQLAGIFLIAAPFCGPGGWRFEGYDFPPDLDERLPADVPIFLYHGQEDEIVPFAHVELFANAIPRAVVRRLPGRDHQLGEDLSEVAADIERLPSR
jgi:predicted alpha/beta hydrolase family esterase